MTTPVHSVAHMFEPIDIGPLTLRSRFMMPPHGLSVGSLWASERAARRGAAYWGSRAADGVGLVCGLNGFIDNSLVVPGFDPTGVGAVTRGVFRMPHFRERAGMYVRAVKEGGAHAGIQLIAQGATPHSPSGVLANYTNNLVPHVLTRSEIAWFVEEYTFSAAESAAAGLDVIELHANHEDLLHLFLSPATNKRTDEYGGDLEGRSRFVREILAGVRSVIGEGMAVGVRMNMDELFEGGYDLAGGIEIARMLEATGHVDYIHCVMGNNWGAPSYIQPHVYPVAGWADLAGQVRAAIGLPVIYTGRVSTPQAAAAVVAQGQADVVGLARAMFAESRFVSKTRSGDFDAVRPCIGTNDCLHRTIVDGIPFSCSVNPGTGHEVDGPLPAADPARTMLVVGGGPAGMETAALLAERGHRVSLWERESELGGQLRSGRQVSENAAYGDFVAFQERRLAASGAQVELGREATLEAVRAAEVDVVVVATGALPRRPDRPGFDAPHVVQGTDVLLGAEQVGERVAVVAMEDHMQPLTIASHLVEQGKKVTIFYPTPSVAPLVGKYSIGAVMAKLSAGGVEVKVMEQVSAVVGDRVVTKNVYSGVEQSYPGFDHVVLACGGDADSSLYDELAEAGVEVHVLGDAYAPRRISFATRQAYALAARL
ncbi:FAD-dependent oxidoreductase [Nocardioides sp. 616]|uniref:oxidoreductase n=1 Tax=Nocardioides sp. 616 TaxID=2268090 RepID=UPI0019659604|nr:FAD-dependent oxidoreductase [Nocardioides sp. 616]